MYGSPNYLTYPESYSALKEECLRGQPLTRASFALQQDFLALEDQKRYFQNKLDEEQKQSVSDKEGLLRRISEKNELVVLLEERVERLEKELRACQAHVQELVEQKTRIQIDFEERVSKLVIEHEYQLQQCADDLKLRHRLELESTVSELK
jgi:hypothetical protein